MINQTAFFAIAKNKPGGAERRFFFLFEYFHSTGKAPYLITNEELWNNLSDAKFPIANTFKESLSGNKVIAGLVFAVKSLQFIRHHKIKQVHFCVNPSSYSAFIVFFLKFLRVKSSVSLVNSMVRKVDDFGAIEKFSWYFTLKNTDIIDFLSPSIKANSHKIFGSSVFTQKLCFISPCSFSKRSEVILQKSVDLGLNEKKKYEFIFVARLIKGKGVELLLEALHLCDNEGYSFTVAVCGDGPLFKTLESISFTNIKLDVLNHVEDLSELLFQSRTALSLQEFENYPSQFLLEALAAQLHIVCTDLGDTRLMLDDEIANLIKYDAVELKDAMLVNLNDAYPVNRNAIRKVLSEHTVGRFAEYFLRNFSS